MENLIKLTLTSIEKKKEDRIKGWILYEYEATNGNHYNSYEELPINTEIVVNESPPKRKEYYPQIKLAKAKKEQKKGTKQDVLELRKLALSLAVESRGKSSNDSSTSIVTTAKAFYSFLTEN